MSFSSFNAQAIELAQVPDGEATPELPPPQNINPPSHVPQTTPKPSQPAEDLLKQGPSSPNTTPKLPETVPESITVTEFEFRGHTVFSSEELVQELAETFDTVLTKTDESISLSRLLQIAAEVASIYNNKGYRTSGAIINIPLETRKNRKGKVIIEVIEGKLEGEPKVIARNAGRLNSYVRSRLGVEPKEPLNVDDLQEALQLLQLDPLIESISATLSAGSDTGKNILEVKYLAAPTFNPQVFLDNGRSPSVGSFERGVLLRKANLLGLGDGISLGYINTDGSDRLDVSYELPFNASNGSLRFNYVQNDSNVVEPPFNDLDIESESRYYELTLRQPVIRSIKERTFQELAFGLTGFWRENESSVLGMPFPLTPGASDDGETSIFALRFLTDWTLQNAQEVIALRSEFSWGLDAFNSTVRRQIPNVEEIPDSQFFAWRGQAQWVRIVDEETSLLIRANAQFAGVLLPSEQFSVGGLGSVRGYRQDQLLTDNGLFTSIEVRRTILRISEGQGRLQLIPFIDYGRGWNSSQKTNPEPNDLVSVGVGLQWQQGDNFTARLDWGIPLVDADLRNRTWQENGILFTVQWNPSF
ncbi:MAG: ShlB/FhaC/HecB family hemolysin secretion/activation protein [Xenococcaceae cyanobacterium MO_188.B32]|nr:ShlB/FhaC/HecB family hemolysin secretion/activation protein [Xenococcaceae cyanobacterium MO_188.B32]